MKLKMSKIAIKKYISNIIQNRKELFFIKEKKNYQLNLLTYEYNVNVLYVMMNSLVKKFLMRKTFPSMSSLII